ncbi:uncharacterized protein QC761_0000350 [Podospora bellae-mahoneyi]|uniref:Rhodopsin domain-containing protein n=1 Tax=Podospora bellae-mahoneyi TaxID=2093777 RepID=A0ABR0FWG7_9PEZI|nr:hypothetical protein QC761_0000350 [Podospora bellae-mahoneyi]
MPALSCPMPEAIGAWKLPVATALVSRGPGEICWIEVSVGPDVVSELAPSFVFSISHRALVRARSRSRASPRSRWAKSLDGSSHIQEVGFATNSKHGKFGDLTNGLGRRYRMRVHVGFALIIAGWLASVVAVFTGCIPFHKYWQISPNPGNSCQPAEAGLIVWSSFAANIASDIYLIVIPLPLLWGSRLRLVEKIGSTLVLSAGIFLLVCATLKNIFVDDINGAELAGTRGTREAFVAVITTNIPMVFPLFKSWLKPLFGSSSQRTTDNKYKIPDGFRPIGGGGGGGSNSHSQFRRGNGNSSNILTNVTFTESEERIVNEIKMQK